MKKADKFMVYVFRLLGVLNLILAVAIFIVKETYIIDYIAMGIMENDIVTMSVILGVSSILFIIISYALKAKIKNDLPVLKMSEEGLIENGTMEIGLIPWDNIEKITIYEIMDGYNTRKYLGIWIKDLGKLCASVSDSKAELIKANAATGAPPVVIPQTLIRTNLSKVIEEIQAYRKEISYREH